MVAMLARLYLCLAALALAAAAYPERPIHLIVPFPPEGPTDVVARVIAPKLAVRLGQKVFVDNRPGRDGITGSAIVAGAAPDGYTLLLTPSSHVLHPATYRDLPFETETAFAPVSLLLQSQLVLVVSPILPVDSVEGLVAFARSRPGRLSYAVAGLGGPTEMAFALFEIASGTNFTREPYAGGDAALAAVAANQAQAMFASLVSAVPMVQKDQVKALAVSGRRRSRILPELPTVADSLPGYSAFAWYGILAPAGTPKTIVDQLGATLDAIVHEPDTAARFAAIGGEPVGGPPGLLGALIKEEIPKWKRVAREAGILFR